MSQRGHVVSSVMWPVTRHVTRHPARDPSYGGDTERANAWRRHAETTHTKRGGAT